MKEIKLDKLEREEHWSKAIFLEKGLSIGDVARVLDLSYPYVSAMLSGTFKITDEQEERITEFIEHLIEEEE